MQAAKEAICGVIHQRLKLVCTYINQGCNTDMKPLRLIVSTTQLMMIRYIHVATLCLECLGGFNCNIIDIILGD